MLAPPAMGAVSIAAFVGDADQFPVALDVAFPPKPKGCTRSELVAIAL